MGRAARAQFKKTSTKSLSPSQRTTRPLLGTSGLFDPLYYVASNQDLWTDGSDPLDHFLAVGAAAQRNPNFYFHSEWYLERNPDVANCADLPIIHYLRIGESQGRPPSPFFRPDWYRRTYEVPIEENALAHYLQRRQERKFNPLPMFDLSYYINTYPDVTHLGDPFEHFVLFGDRESRLPFEGYDIYLQRQFGMRRPFLQFVHVVTELETINASPEADRQENDKPMQQARASLPVAVMPEKEQRRNVAVEATLDDTTSGTDRPTSPPLDKTLTISTGAKQAVDWRALAKQFFDSEWYIRQLGLSVDVDAFDHWWNRGRHNGQSPNPLFDHGFYASQLPNGLIVEKRDLFLHFLSKGNSEDHDPHPCFCQDWYRSRYSNLERNHPWIDYQLNGSSADRSPNWLFSSIHRLEMKDVAANAARPLLALFLENVMSKSTSPHPLLDRDFVMKYNNDIDGEDFYKSFWIAYRKRDIRTHLYFDPVFYRSQIQDRRLVARSLLDYIQHGEAENLQPLPLFVPDWYAKHYGRPHGYDSELEGFVAVGESLYRHPCPGFDPRFYLETHSDVARAGRKALTHFVTTGQRELRACHRRFNIAWYAARLPEELRQCALDHWILVGRAAGHAPHAAVRVEQRGTAAGALLAYLDPTPHPFTVIPGLTTALNGRQQFASKSALTPVALGQAWLVDEFEKRHRASGIRDAQVQKRNEDIARQYETFNYDHASAVVKKIVQDFSQSLYDLPLVSVIIPTRNRVKVLGRSIKSAIYQTYRNLEILVVDDGSLDNTDEFIQKYFVDPRLRIISLPASGVSAARNAGIEHANGTYIAYVDSDNYWEPLHIEVVVKTLLLTKALAGYSTLRAFNDKNVFRYRGDIYDADALARENYIDMNVYVHHRSVVDQGLRFDDKLKRCVDWDFILRASKTAPPIYIPIIGCNYVDDSGLLERITTDELSGDFYKVCQANISLEPHITGGSSAQDYRTSIVWPISSSDWLTIHDTLWAIVEHCAINNDELIIINNALDTSATNYLKALSQMTDSVKVIHLWRTFKVFPAANLASLIAKGRFLLVWDSSVQFDSKSVNRFIDLSDESNAEISTPLVVNSQGKVVNCIALPQTTSHVFAPIVTGQSAADLSGSARNLVAFDAPTFIRMSTFREEKGFSSGFAVTFGLADLCLRRLSSDTGHVRTDFECRFYTLAQPGAEPSQLEYQKEFNLLKELWTGREFPRPVFSSNYTFIDFKGVQLVNKNWDLYPDLNVGMTLAAPSLQKALKFVLRCPAPDTPEKVSWGDYHYARAMQVALERFGHEACLEFSSSWEKPQAKGDIVFHIRGIVDLKPSKDAVNIAWIISHPEKIKASEVSTIDVIFVAGPGVKQYFRQHYGLHTHLLLQATDHTRFGVDITPVKELSGKALFVGNSRLQMRPVVLDSLAAGLPLVVYGNDWDKIIPTSLIGGTYVDNEQLANWYGSAAVVLNDHWPTMREFGIISNRIFDAVATGRPVISDHIEGLPDIFGEAVSTYQSVVDLPVLFEEKAKTQYLEVARSIRSNHTIEHRMSEVLDVLSIRKH
jgi:glycosyltransferase involved in cell wall biosynthesis